MRLSHTLHRTLLHPYTGVLIGFQEAAAKITESLEVVEVTVVLLNGTIAEGINLYLQLYSEDLTALGGTDLHVHCVCVHLRNAFIIT